MEIEEKKSFELNKLADDYKKTKIDAKKNILECGRILIQANSNCSHGEWLKWLNDNRVNESVSTAYNLIQIYKTFGNLQSIVNLGLVQLIELRKLPKKFKTKKEIEIEPSHFENVECVDEEKLNKFLNKEVTIKDSKTKKPIEVKIGQLPTRELKKYVGVERKKAGETVKRKSALLDLLNYLDRKLRNYEFVKLDDVCNDEEKEKIVNTIERLIVMLNKVKNN